MSNPTLRIIFMGTPEFAVPSIISLHEAGYTPVLCVSQPDKPQGRKRVITPTPVHQIANQLGIDCYQPTKVRNQEFYQTIESYKPDFIITAAYGRILPETVLQIPKFDSINIHASLLPSYRGASPVQAALFAGDKTTGISIIRMTKEMDKGPIYSQKPYDIPEGMRADDLMQALSELASQMIVETVLSIANGAVTPVEQDESQASYVQMLDKRSGFINWNQDAAIIEGQVRACYPWPSAQASLQGKKVKIHQAKAFPLEAIALGDNDYPLGSVVSLQDKNIWVLCKDSLLCIEEIQFSGSRAMSAKECSHNLTLGLQFEDGE